MTDTPPEIKFQSLLERSDKVYRKFLNIAVSPVRDDKVMTELVYEGQVIADEMRSAVDAKHAALRQHS